MFGTLAPLLVLAFAVLLLVLVWRVWGRRRLAAEGRCFEVRLGEQVSRAAVESLMSTVAGGLPRPLLGSAPWVALELSSTEDRAGCGLFVSGGVPVAQVRAAVEQGLGGVTVETVGLGPPAEMCEHMRVASLAPGGSRFLPLRVDHRVDPAGQLLAALRAHEPREGGAIQLVLQAPPRSAANRARGQARRLRAGRGLQPDLALRALQAVGGLLLEFIDVFLPGSPPAGQQTRVDPFSLERAKAIEAKAAQPLLAATLRVGAWADGRRRAGGRLGGLLAAFGQFHDLGGLHKSFEPFCKRRMTFCLPPVKPRLLLSSSEAAALIAVPEETALAPLSFSEAPSRSIAPAAHAPSHGFLLGRSDHAGFDREIRVEPKALLGHAHVLGPTGRGKSTLLLNMTVEAIRAGMGGIVLDPTGELTTLTLARIPAERVEDVDLLDLGDTSYPPALNLLASAPGDGDAHAQAICGIFARLFSRFWGPRTEDILRSALTTLLCGRDPAGPAPTLADVLTLLSDPGERTRYRASDPVALDVFWRQWQTLSEQARVQALAPLSNKLRALLGNRQLRNMLCQPAAPDLSERISAGRWLLVSLPQTLGEDAADLIGSVLLHRAWQAAQRLGPIALADRPPFLCLVDECHRFCHMPQGMATALAQARGYGVGMVLAHQNLAQLKDSELAEAVDANCQTKLCFGLGAADAKRMVVHFQPRLDAHDLLHLSRHTIACRVAHEHHQLPAATATTEPPPPSTRGDTASVVRGRARANASDRRAVEAAINERYGRIEQPPQGHAHADEQTGDNFDSGSAEVPPFGPPFGAPTEGGPPLSGIPYQHGDPGSEANPDNEHLIPGGGRP
ncbi:MAG TPA: TraM recognition domain-containing protein [Solirubrobacteraceae bacterium]|nr:TraM recognition domain-containing protein [Solirubrobacteraceae bacterium]